MVEPQVVPGKAEASPGRAGQAEGARRGGAVVELRPVGDVHRGGAGQGAGAEDGERPGVDRGDAGVGVGPGEGQHPGAVLGQPAGTGAGQSVHDGDIEAV